MTRFVPYLADEAIQSGAAALLAEYAQAAFELRLGASLGAKYATFAECENKAP